MNTRKLIFTAIILLSCASTVTVSAQTGGRSEINFNSGWKFIAGDPENAHLNDFNDAKWRLLDLPHDWSIEGTVSQDAPAGGSGGYYPGGVGWYRKNFRINAGEMRMKHRIVFDGVYMNSDIWLNGKNVGNYPFGYNTFWYDLDPFLKEGDNVIAVRVNNSQQPNSRWYSGSGIYRNVWLIRTNLLHIPQWGVYVTTPEITEEKAVAAVSVKIINNSRSAEKAVLESFVTNDEGINAGQTQSSLLTDAGMEQTINQVITVEKPDLWSVETPAMYTLVTRILVKGKVIDEVKTPFGIRSIEYDVDKGFLLNGKSVKMNGVCLHHDAGCLGAAVPVKVWERRLLVLKEMGCNAIRTAHNPVAPEFLDLCDRMGFLVMNEIFDEWTVGKVKYGYNIYFNEWAEKDVISFIHRDRNHPSVVMWSAGNEVREQPREGGHLILKKLQVLFLQYKPVRGWKQALFQCLP